MSAVLSASGDAAGMLVLPEVTVANPDVDRLVTDLAAASIGATCNMYSDLVDGGGERRGWLRRYLTARWQAPVVLVGEAAGYAGARLSGIAFTSVYQLGAGTQKELSAAIVHKTLAVLGAEEQVLLWNTVPTHPHQPGQPRSNRTPTAAEVAAGAAFLSRVAAGRLVVGVGRIAARQADAPYIRHPSHGGARAFADGLAAVLADTVCARHGGDGA